MLKIERFFNTFREPVAVYYMLAASIFTEIVVKSGHWTEQETFERHLKDMIYPSKSKGIITHDNITEVLRVFRNLVHPAREIRDGLVFRKIIPNTQKLR